MDIVNSSNEVALGLLLQGKMDLSNNFLPGIANLVKGNFNIKTYYPEAPYMLSANTAWLIPNTTKAPMNDAAFRRALASSDRHQEDRRGRLRQHRQGRQPDRPAADLGQWVDKAVRRRAGFSYDTGQGEEDAGRRRLQGHER